MLVINIKHQTTSSFLAFFFQLMDGFKEGRVALPASHASSFHFSVPLFTPRPSAPVWPNLLEHFSFFFFFFSPESSVIPELTPNKNPPRRFPMTFQFPIVWSCCCMCTLPGGCSLCPAVCVSVHACVHACVRLTVSSSPLCSHSPCIWL